jgi:acyl-CoA synthetase (AMP-forming)/AMP-acid ligase II
MVELRGDRYYFVGRRGGIINVGGQKVHPEEVEAVINAHPQVRISLVRAKKSSFTGALVVADVVLNSDAGIVKGQSPEIEQDILRHCRASLPRHKVPAAITFVASLALASTGKIARRNA